MLSTGSNYCGRIVWGGCVCACVFQLQILRTTHARILINKTRRFLIICKNYHSVCVITVLILEYFTVLCDIVRRLSAAKK